MRIQHNIMAMNANRQLGINNSSVAKSLEKLSSGFRINRAGDDAAGLAISEKMRAEIGGLKMAERNAQDGISLIQTAEGALDETGKILRRMHDLAEQSANGTYADTDRENLQLEIDALKKELDRIPQSVTFNEKNILDGSLDPVSRGTIDFKGSAATTTNAGVNSFKMDVEIIGKDGKPIANNLTVKFGDGAAAAKAASATFDQANQLTINLKSGANNKDVTTYTQADIQAAINNAIENNTGGSLPADVESIKVTLSNDIVFTQVATPGAPTAAAPEVAVTASKGSPLTLQVGTHSGNFDQISVSIKNMNATGLGVKDVDITTQDNAKLAIDTTFAAIKSVAGQRAELGALQNRLEHTVANIGVTTENLQASESRIRDANMPEEMMEFTKNNVLVQAAQAMLAQANQQPQSVLQLLR